MRFAESARIIIILIEVISMPFDSFDTRELFARLIQCEAGGEGEDGTRVLSCLLGYN